MRKTEKIERIVLDEWQEEILKTEGNIALRSGRQTGKSTIISILAGEYAANNPNKLIMIISLTERQAYLLFEKVLAYMDDNHRKLIKTGKDRPTKTKIELKNGSKILCLPTGATGHGIRGFTIDWLVADEAAFIPEAVFSAITPALAARRNTRIILLSTPFGKQGYFYKAFASPEFKTFHISSEQCRRISKEFLESEKKRMTKAQYMQEYLGEWVSDGMQWFPDELIRKRMTLLKKEEIDKTKCYFLGVDLARMGNDESTFAIGYLEKDRVIMTDLLITKRTYLSDSTNLIINLHEKYKFKEIYIDSGGIGVGVLDHLLDDERTRRVVKGIDNSKRVIDYHDDTKTRLMKEDLYSNLLRLMETAQIELLDSDEVYSSLKCIQYEYISDEKGKTMLKIYGVPHDNTHTVEAIIRLAWCIKRKNLNIWISSF